MRLLVVGAKHVRYPADVFTRLYEIDSDLNVTELLCDDAPGVGVVAQEWAKMRNIKIFKMAPDYELYGCVARVARNVALVKVADRVVVFPDCDGKCGQHVEGMAIKRGKLVGSFRLQ